MNPEYIKQCAAAKELQEAWEPEEGDYFIEFVKDKPVNYGIEIVGLVPIAYPHIINSCRGLIHDHGPYNRKHKTLVWLPTQEQLWALLPQDEYITVRKGGGLCSGEIGFTIGVMFKGEEYHIEGDTIESILIQMVMKCNHNKTWDEKGAWA